jgi:hypothetical protein
MSRVPRVRTKLQCLLFRKQFAALSGELDTALATIQQAIAQVSAVSLSLSFARALALGTGRAPACSRALAPTPLSGEGQRDVESHAGDRAVGRQRAQLGHGQGRYALRSSPRGALEGVPTHYGQVLPHCTVWKAAASKADPRPQQDWFLKCL